MDECSCSCSQSSTSSSSSDAATSSQHSYNRSPTLINDGKYSFKKVLREVTSTKGSCIEFLQMHGVIPKTLTCPGPLYKGKRMQNCGHEMLLKHVKDRKDGVTWRCRKVHEIQDKHKVFKVKDVKVSIREGTWLADSNLTLEEILELIYLWTQNFTLAEIEHELGISKKTLIEWTIYFRDVCTCIALRQSEPIGGERVQVEIDESKFGKRKYNKGRQVDGMWVFGGREKYDKSKIFMVPVPDRKKATLIPLIEKYIKKGSIIHSDCWRSYHCLKDIGYTHKTVNHSKTFKNYRTGACTNKIESEWRHAKCSVPPYGIHKGLHEGYLAEFLWKRKHHDKDLFLTFINHLNYSFNHGEVTPAPK